MKQSGYILKQQLAMEARMEEMRLFTIQQCKDVAMCAARKTFKIGPVVAKRYSDDYDETWYDLADTTLNDTKDIEYTKAKLDECLKEFLGEHFVPHEERYDMRGMMNRHQRRREAARARRIK